MLIYLATSWMVKLTCRTGGEEAWRRSGGRRRWDCRIDNPRGGREETNMSIEIAGGDDRITVGRPFLLVYSRIARLMDQVEGRAVG